MNTKKLIKNAIKCLKCNDMCERIEVWEDGDKIRCIDDSEQNTLKLNEVYTVDTSMNTTEDRVYIKENKRFSFLKSRFKLLEVLL